MKNYLKFFISILLTLVIGFAGSFFTSSSVNDWYTTLNKPIFNPPNWLFGPVWTLLFILIGLSFYFVWIENFGKQKKIAIGIYSFQLILNLLWSFLFFGLKKPFLALIEIFFLWMVIITNLIMFYKISKKAGLLLIPYLLWVTFAAILNLFIFVLN